MFSEFEQEGYDAARAGEPHYHNPYDLDSKQGRDWAWGWRLAKNDERDAEIV